MIETSVRRGKPATDTPAPMLAGTSVTRRSRLVAITTPFKHRRGRGPRQWTCPWRIRTHAATGSSKRPPSIALSVTGHGVATTTTSQSATPSRTLELRARGPESIQKRPDLVAPRRAAAEGHLVPLLSPTSSEGPADAASSNDRDLHRVDLHVRLEHSEKAGPGALQPAPLGPCSRAPRRGQSRRTARILRRMRDGRIRSLTVVPIGSLPSSIAVVISGARQVSGGSRQTQASVTPSRVARSVIDVARPYSIRCRQHRHWCAPERDASSPVLASTSDQ